MTPRQTLGRRTQRVLGPVRAPKAEERDWVRRMAVPRTRVPKGVFRYRSMADANADWERWHAELVAQTVLEKAGGRFDAE
jgi:hypothetical protein